MGRNTDSTTGSQYRGDRVTDVSDDGSVWGCLQ
jgi:hypothetical protein